MYHKQLLNKAFIAVLLLLNFKFALAVVPPTLNYQGHLTDSAGVPIDGPVTMIFSVYDIATGGTTLWSDTRSVTVDQGVFSEELGGGINPFPLGLFENPLWMGLTVATDAEMSPRRPISSTAYSFKADDANTLEGISASTLDQSTHVIDTANPHNVTAAQTGAADAATLSAHTSNASNPHSVTAAQTGAATSASFSLHTGDASAHHSKTTNYAEMIGTVPDANIASTISRDSELASHSTSQSVHHSRYNDSEAVTAIKAADGAGSTLDADMVDGLQASEIIDAAQDEVRTPISSLPYTITQPGSYYFTGNLTATSSGININTDNVTLDLMGFTLDGNGVSDHGIYLLSQSNVTIMNGTVRGFGFAGIYQSNISDGHNTVIDISVVANGTVGTSSSYAGIRMNGYYNHIERCRAIDNGGPGISITYSSKIINNTVAGNTGSYGIYGGTGALISNNIVEANTGSGIYVLDRSRLIDNTVSANLGAQGIYGGNHSSITGNLVDSNGGIGINTADNAVISGNTSTNNASTGIVTAFSSIIERNSISKNGDKGLIATHDNVITNNVIEGNQRWGIDAIAANLISNNTINFNNRSLTVGEGGLRIVNDNRIIGNMLDNNDDYNILITNGDNMLKDNHITDGDFGIRFEFSGNYYRDNTAAGNGSSFYTVGFTQTDGGGNVIF